MPWDSPQKQEPLGSEWDRFNCIPHPNPHVQGRVALIVLSFDAGSIVARGGPIPNSRYDGRLDAYRASAYLYRDIIASLRREGVEYRDEALKPLPCPKLASRIALRDYQQRALESWKAAGCRGVVVLPTGAGKTVLALKAIEETNAATLVVVPTLVLVEQWRSRLEEAFSVEVGVVGGGSHVLRCLTVATYNSASLRAESLGNLFNLLILDEVHHLPAPAFRRIGEMYLAPFRLGLTATLEREDMGHLSIVELVGGKVYERGVGELAGTHLSDFTIQTIPVPLTEGEQAEYESQYGVYTNFLRRRGIQLRSAKDFQRFVMRSGRDPEARRALIARNRAMDIALNSEVKIKHLKELLLENPSEKAIIFTQHNSLVYRISKEMLIPAITHQTPREERDDILDKFRSGQYRRVVTSRVLDEGVDVPDASLALILSGTGSSREFIQRLGRVLRKKTGKRARLIELVSRGTAETRLSRRRKEI